MTTVAAGRPPRPGGPNTRAPLQIQVLRNKKPARIKKASNAMVAAPENGGLRKKRNSSSGCSRRDSTSKKAIAPAAATTKQATMGAEVHPSVGPSMMP